MNTTPETATITLGQPIKRGESEITEITLCIPRSGNLRGVSLRALLDMEADAIATVIPRVGAPKLLPQEIAIMHPADLLQCGAALANFLLPPSAVEEARKQVMESQSGSTTE